MTDVRLDDVDETYLTLDARVVKAEASDFMLDSAQRRRGGGPFRRALVHDQNDGLTVNFAGDYPGGVTLTGTVQMAGPVHLTEIIPPMPGLVVHGGISYEVPAISLNGSVTRRTIVVDAVLADLRSQINQLSDRIAALEALPHP